MHAGEEGIASRGAALLRVVVGEHRTFISDAIDVWCLSDHQATVIDARLHPADVVAHDEEDVWLLSLLRAVAGPLVAIAAASIPTNPSQIFLLVVIFEAFSFCVIGIAPRARPPRV